MAAANESQGLKIAVAVFVTLTVVLAVTTYFAYSSYDQALAQKTDAETKARESQASATSVLRDLEDLATEAGYDKQVKAGEYATAKEQMKKDKAALNERLAAMNGTIKQMVDAARANGASPQKVEELSAAADQIVAQLATEPNQSFLSRQARMLELVDNMTQLVTSYSLDNEKLRKDLADVNGINAEQLKVTTARADEAEQGKARAETETQTVNQQLHDQVDKLGTDLAAKVEEVTKLTSQIEQMKTEYAKTMRDLTPALRSVREENERKADVMLDKANGRITYVDNTRGEVRTDLTRRDGGYPQLVLRVFDRDSPGLPTDKPKGTIELISVNDSYSIGRIVKTEQTHEPIRYGDQIYSPSFGKKTYALIGKIDIDRDGVDDREDLKRLIRASGGEVTYDLPPTNVGRESGKLTPLTTWYVQDGRDPIRGVLAKKGVGSDELDGTFYAKQRDALRLARLEGIRPIAIQRLLDLLGYEFGAKVPGRVEAKSEDAINSLVNPGGRATTPPPAIDDEEMPADEEALPADDEAMPEDEDAAMPEEE
jgi:hypothetical protein